MDLFKQLNQIENIKDINELIQTYSFESLKKLYQEIIKQDLLHNENVGLFFESLKIGESIKEDDKFMLSQIWNKKLELQKYHQILLKALTTIERNKILRKTEEITNKLTNIVENIE